jgi:hypothetical protein
VFDEIQFDPFSHHHYIDAPPDEQRSGSIRGNRAWSPREERSRRG